MSPHRSRFVTASQQLLALAVVLVALAPAARVLSLDVVATQPPAHRLESHPAALSRLVGHPLTDRELVASGW